MNPPDYKSEPQEKTLAITSTTKMYGPTGSLKAVEVQDLDADLAIFLHFVGNPWCLSFDGTNDVVDLDTAAADLAALDVAVIMAGIFIDTAGSGARTIFSISDASAETAMVLRITAADKLEATLVIGGTVKWTLITTEALTMDAWMRIKLAHDGVEPKLFVENGTPKQSFSVSADKTAWLSDLTGIDTVNIGALDYNSAGNANFFDGKIDYLAIRNGEGADAALALNCQLTEGSGTTATDASSNGNDGTISGASWVTRTRGIKQSAAYTRIYTESEAPIGNGLWITNEDGTDTVDVIVRRKF